MMLSRSVLRSSHGWQFKYAAASALHRGIASSAVRMRESSLLTLHGWPRDRGMLTLARSLFFDAFD